MSSEVILEEFKAGIPMGDFAVPEDIAAVVAFLASADSCRMTGTKVIVDCGCVECDTYHRINKGNTNPGLGLAGS